MGNKRDGLPIVIASAIALVITGIVRWLIPGGTVIKQQPLKKELSLPDIPLMIKSEQKKIKEIQVLVTNSDIRKDEKIIRGKLTWKTWPANAVQPYFIAQDNKGNPMNNRADYNNALNMWANNDIPVGIPLTISMLTSTDPAEVARKKKAEEEAAAAAEKIKDEEKKKKAAKGSDELIRIGYRAVSFQVDQRTPISSNMISPGDYIDVRINANVGGEQKTYVYKSLKIIAIDGMTKKDKEERKENSGGIFGGLGGMSTPRNVTLEIKESMVNTMLRQASNSGIILTVRSQHEMIEEDDEESSPSNESKSESKAGSGEDANLLRDLWKLNNRYSSAAVLRNSVQKKRDEENNLSLLLRSINNINRLGHEKDSVKRDSSNYEIVNGRMVSNPNDSRGANQKQEPVRIYRKLVPEEIQFDKSGKKVSKGSDFEGNNSGVR